MPLSTPDTENLSLGEFLRETRIKLGCDIRTVAEETKITQNNLLAIEDSNFSALPAEVFTRGFYTIYSKFLSLDPQEVLTRYGQERKNLPKDGQYRTLPPNRLAQNMKNLADPPSSLPFAYFGFSLLLLLLFGAFLCWYFSWNPASYLSVKLRSLDDSQPITQSKTGGSPPAVLQSKFAKAQSRNPTPAKPNLLDLSIPSIATAATSQPEERKETSPAAGTTKYHVHAVFQEATKISLALDESPQRTMTFKPGEQVSWRAVEKLIITLPVTTNTKISLNGYPIELPQPNNDCITLAIPELILR